MSATQEQRPKVLIANRGEIAIRVARTARRLGFGTVAIFSDADRMAEHVRYCDEAVYVGGPAPKDSYLHVERVIGAAKKTGAKYIHPGYGFLSERPHFAEACIQAGITFVGPTAENMRLMGDKIQARKTVDALKMPRVPGSAGSIKDAAEAARFAREVGYPVLLKAAAGGGGKGMRRVDNEAEIASAFEGATREAQGAFGDGSMYVEKLILEPHHVEIQVFGDGRGRAIHLGERECSIQRRHQKVWEESPAPILNQYPETRQKMFDAAIRVAESVKYAGAGTFEFIVDGKGNFYFLEMNTRLQVEHPVTEWVTGMDLVALQLQLASGELKQLPSIPERRGSSIEVRLYAEDPRTFLPAPGRIGDIRFPNGPFVRVDTSFTEPGEVSLHYDPMIAKIAVWAPTREEAVGRMQVALDETRVEAPKDLDGRKVGSLKTNLDFLRRLVRNPDTRNGNTTTDLIPNNPDLTLAPTADGLALEAALAVALDQLIRKSESGAEAWSGSTLWSAASRRESVRT